MPGKKQAAYSSIEKAGRKTITAGNTGVAGVFGSDTRNWLWASEQPYLVSSAVAARRRPATVVAKTRVARRFLQSSSRAAATRAMPRPLARRDALRKVKYGRSDMVVSELCAGSMTWGSFNGNEAEAHAQLGCFVKNGVNFFDTAE